MRESSVQASAFSITAPKAWLEPSSHWQVVLSHPWYKHVVRLQHEMQIALHQFFVDSGLLMVAMPLTTGSISSPMGLGSDSLPVEVEVVGVKTYLADSMQFMLEFGCRLHSRGVYYIMPCFRGEATDAYHLPQFYHVETEIPGTLEDIVQLSNRMVHSITTALLSRCSESIERLAGSTKHVEALLAAQGRYPRMRFDDALADLGSDSKWVKKHPAGFSTITRAAELELVKRHGAAGAGLWLTHFDELSVPFYQASDGKTGKALAADFILGGCETIGSGQRHSTVEDATEALRKREVSADPYAWYLAMRQLHPLQTAGMGMGLERYLLWIIQHNDIRDLTLLYRQNGLCVEP